MSDDEPLELPKFLREVGNNSSGGEDPPPLSPVLPGVDKMSEQARLSDQRSAEERERKLSGLRSRVNRSRAMKAREGEFIPGATWDVRYSRWVHPTLEKEKNMAAKMADKSAEYNKILSEAEARGNKPKGFRPVKKFESLAAAEKRINQLKAALGGAAAASDPPEGGSAPEPSSSGESVGTTQPVKNAAGDVKMSKTNVQKKDRNLDGIRRPVGKVTDFRAVRAGSRRAVVLKMADGRHTIDQIAKKIEADRKTVLTHLFCMNRDCAIGYEVNDRGVQVNFPGSKTLSDAIKQKDE